ncbi:hypothetical protein E6C76_21060 [Pseudothauera nasutitermitis]|uniref:Uncharacterized protein n=1 Tax=Pseudothauera nasutitermitis TaxID=2565930 RepID=A0A4S4AN73_9RHOO|nr:hypothetical protein [Pseudothauera nasutitermitis]THF61085.1 hypothetical protein E6C76_21060 [Pseudothauera nasutitermitis]
MFEQDFRIIHGWVEDILADPAHARYRLRVRQGGEQAVEMAMGKPGWPVRLGDEVSVVVCNTDPTGVVALIDHTTGDGMNLLYRGMRQRPDGQDAVIATTVIGVAVLAVGWLHALAVSVAFIPLYWLATHWLPENRRQRAAARIDFMIDREYCRWRAMRDRPGAAR